MYNFKVKSSICDYDVQFIDDFEQLLASELAEGDFIIVDNKIKHLYGAQLSSVLEKYQHIGIDATEFQKSYQGIIPIIQSLIENGFKKNYRLVAIGGGITQDITAFISSIMYRGVKWIFFPTTLLSQGDSCIGSKTSINFGEYKNQVGGFYPPEKIFICPKFIDTLSDFDIKSGMGEMLHYFIVSSKKDFIFYKKSFEQAMVDKNIMSEIIMRSLEIKKKYIEADEFDQNIRQVFNYGHSFGHAIESLTYYKIPHGIAVSFGMDISNFISVRMGLISEEIRKEIREVLEIIWKGYSINNIDIQLFKKALSKDKKNVGSRLGIILNNGYGNIFKNVMDNDKKLTLWLEEYFSKEVG